MFSFSINGGENMTVHSYKLKEISCISGELIGSFKGPPA